MNQKPFQRVSFEWLSKTSNPSEEIEKCDFGARGQVAYAMPPEYGKGHYEAFELTLGMNFVKSTFQYSPTMRGKPVPMMEVKAEYMEPSVRMLFLRGLRGNVKVENPTAQLLSSPGEDIFHYTTGFRANYVADGSYSGEIISFSIGRTVLNQLIGDEVAESLLVQLGIADLPSITKHPIPLHISQLMFNAVNPALSGMTQKLFCQAKVLEYLAAMVHFLCADDEAPPNPNDDARQRAHDIHSQLIACERRLPTLDQLAKQYGCSAKRLNEQFSQEFGKPIYTFMLDYRLDQAHVALQQSAVPIKLLADRLGYSHVNNFSIAFKRKFGYPPGGLRKQKI